jgi:hypothetical protein
VQDLLVLDNQRVYFNYGFRVYLGDKFDDLVFTRVVILSITIKKNIILDFRESVIPQQFFKT